MPTGSLSATLGGSLVEIKTLTNSLKKMAVFIANRTTSIPQINIIWELELQS